MHHLPDWIKVKSPIGSRYREMKRLLEKYSVNTICQSALCPNIWRCFNSGCAAFLILGRTCTRHCLYCNVSNGKPEKVNDSESIGIAKIVNHFGMKHVCVTSVTRDDLPDGGAYFFVETIKEIRKINPETTIEVLIPDFGGSEKSLRKVINENPEILNHNIETVERLYPVIRPEADYKHSIELLRKVKRIDGNIKTKSGIMMGLGETKEEVIKTMVNLRNVSCDILTIGQYLRPSEMHCPVIRYYHPDEFIEMKEIGKKLGFSEVKSSPLVRSSYQLNE